MSLTKTAADRLRFTVLLRPGDSTVVSWKKLVKDAAAAAASALNNNHLPLDEPPTASQPPLSNALPPLGVAPEKIGDKGLKDELPTNRFNAVIEKIERLYKGTDSGDEDDLNEVPDDDQYDTEDSFIDDEELDEYFQVDDLATKHNGFFVNRGKLEQMNDLSSVSGQEPKKRRRKDLQKTQAGCQVALASNKHGKVENTVAKNNSGHSQCLSSSNELYDDDLHQKQKKTKFVDTKTTLEPVLALKAPKDDKSASQVQMEDTERISEVTQFKSHNKQVKRVTESSDAHPYQNCQSGRSDLPPQFLSERKRNSLDEISQSTHLKKRKDTLQIPGVNLSASKQSMQTAQKDARTLRKDGTAVIRPKGSMLERALKELEKAVAETKPPPYEQQDADVSSQTVKKRLPGEIKQKLAKVARLAASQGKISHGKMSEELSNRLMSMLGHLMQLRTLKRNLREMIRTGLSVKQEKYERFQQVKKEVADLVKALVPPMDFLPKIGTSDDFQESNHEDKKATSVKYRIDKALEDKMCNLYDLYVDGLDEDAGSQSTKLYAELAELWPSGSMDSHRIKHAIGRAKDRKCAYRNQSRKIQRKKLLGPRTDDSSRPDSTYTSQPQYMQGRMASDSSNQKLTSADYKDGKAAGLSHSSSPSINAARLKESKQLKKIVPSSTSMEEGHDINIQLLKKKKRKLTAESTQAHMPVGKMPLLRDGQQHTISSSLASKKPNPPESSVNQKIHNSG